MNEYVKPSIKLASAASPRGLSSCNTTAEDMDLIQSIIGGADANNTFGMGEDCLIEIPLDMYCKFTSTELGAAHVFWS